MQIDIVGYRDFQSALKRYAPETRKELTKRLRALAKTVALDASSRAPRDTGALAASIKPSSTMKGAAIRSKLPYARISEFGGRHPVFGDRENWKDHPERPFMRPAVNDAREKAVDEARAAIDEAFRKAGFPRGS